MGKPTIKLHFMGADKQLRKHLPQIKQISRSAIAKIAGLLQFKEDVDVIIYRYHAPEKNLAVSGYAPNGNLVWIYIDPSQKDFKKTLGEQLPKALAHELHHAARWQGPGFGETLEEVLITEGLASHFEQEVFGGKPASYYVKFLNKDLVVLWNKAQRELKSDKFSYDDWFFGNKKQNLPKHGGYALAYWLMESVSVKPSTLARVRAGQVIKKMI